MRFRKGGDFGAACEAQQVRYFRGLDTIPAKVPKRTISGNPADEVTGYPDNTPGPTLRARVGDIVQLTFLNHVNPSVFGDSFDKGEKEGACDQSSGYPGDTKDQFPNCFHGSSTANIHFHGTHTNPNSTGDNVFLQVRPSPRENGNPSVTAESVKDAFDAFFRDCERRLRADILSVWPHTWSDLTGPASRWTRDQKVLIDAYDATRREPQRLWPANKEQLDNKGWPQYYIGAFPYCFQLPRAGRPMRMGQAPGTHWYHAHKHGSTALNVSLGMTGAFIIEGKYDDDLNDFYGKIDGERWTLAQPVLVINQLGNQPNLVSRKERNKEWEDFSVNGRFRPKLTMRPGEVQLWRIINTSSRSGVYFEGPPAGFQWMQLAQDGVQFAYPNYKASLNKGLLLATGNRADLLVKAPVTAPQDPVEVKVWHKVAEDDTRDANPGALMYVTVRGEPVDQKSNQSRFIGEGWSKEEPPREYPKFPQFLNDIRDEEINYVRPPLDIQFHPARSQNTAYDKWTDIPGQQDRHDGFSQ